MAHENKSNRNIGLLYTFASIMYHPLLFSNLQHLRNNPKKKKKKKKIQIFTSSQKMRKINICF